MRNAGRKTAAAVRCPKLWASSRPLPA